MSDLRDGTTKAHDTVADSTVFPLLDLPPEVRILIFQNLRTPGYRCLAFDYTDDAYHLSEYTCESLRTTPGGCRHRRSQTHWHIAWGYHAAILRVSKTLNTEAKAVLWDTNTWQIQFGGGKPLPTRLLPEQGPLVFPLFSSMIPHIRHVSITVLPKVLPRVREDSRECVEELVRRVAELPRLRSVVLDGGDREWLFEFRRKA